MRVKDLQPREAITISKGDRLRDAAKFMAEDDIGVLVVIDAHGPVGIIGERDIVRALGDDAYETSVVADYMTEAPVGVRETAPIGEAIARMNDSGVRHLMVTDEDDTLSGVISMRDLVALLGSHWPEL